MPSTCCPEVFSLLYLYCSQPCFLVSEAHCGFMSCCNCPAELLVVGGEKEVVVPIANRGRKERKREQEKGGKEGRIKKDPAGGPQHLPSSSVCSAVMNRDKLGAY